MSGRLQDTIAACVTGPGPGAVAVVRVSGPRAWEACQGVFSPWPRLPVSHRAFYGVLTHGEDALILLFEEGRGYTGEQAAEISLHGSLAGVRLLLEDLMKQGARMAEPGEFTLRAFMNGRLDLAQAEGVRALVESSTQAQLRQASSLRDGALSRKVGEVRGQLLSVMAAIEASTDFSDEVGEADGPALASRLDQAEEVLESLARQAAYGQAVFSGWKIAIVGPPNAGKSSLLNAVLGFDRAIVTPIPGTTRDTLAERVEISGFPCLLVDTAGLRESPDLVESMGIERALQERETADLVWEVFDASASSPPSDVDPRALRVANKIDLSPAPPGSIGVSCLTGEGLAALIEATSERLPEAPSSPVLPRHLPLLEGARDRVREAADTLRSPIPPDLAVVMLQGGVRMLGEITGETAPPDVIEQIFRDFCIGK